MAAALQIYDDDDDDDNDTQLQFQLQAQLEVSLWMLETFGLAVPHWRVYVPSLNDAIGLLWAHLSRQ